MSKAFFSSEDMALCQLLMHEDNAFNCLSEVGHVGYLQFNSVYEEDHPINGLYTKKVQLCHDLQHIVENLHDQMIELKIRPNFYENVDDEERPRESKIPQYEAQLKSMNTEMHSVMENHATLEKRYGYLQEKRTALQVGSKLLMAQGSQNQLYSDSIIRELMLDQSDADPHSSKLNYVLGTIDAEKFQPFELFLYRLFGRNLLVRHADLPNITVLEGKKKITIHKFVVLLMTISEQIKPKLLKCCTAFHVTIFECPESNTQRALMIEQLDHEIADLDLVQKQTHLVRRRILTMAAINSYIMHINLNKSIKIYDLLNRLSPVGGQKHQKYLQAECYVPVRRIKQVRDALNAGSLIEDSLGPVNNIPPILVRHKSKSKQMPPTFFELNKFTKGFQSLIDSYGMADFKELNPAPYTIITFPFLFAIMFGDIGHGIILTIFAAALIWKDDTIEEMDRRAKNENEILNILYAGRYIILLMGIFSIYVGFIYNDLLGLSLNIFGSSWSHNFNTSFLKSMTRQLDLDPSDKQCYKGEPYPFGFDPMWMIAGEDSITTLNSLKMKLAIILGVTQMMFGLILSAVNCFRLNRPMDFILVVLPQIIFLTCLFVYLVFLIFLKWFKYGGLKSAPYHSACAPSVLIIFIDMLLMKTTDDLDPACDKGMFPGERTLEYVLVFIALAMIPIMLAGKPLYVLRKQKKQKGVKDQRDMKSLKLKGINTLNFMRSTFQFAMAGPAVEEEHVPEQQGKRNEKENQQYSEQQQLLLSDEEDEEEIEFDALELWIHSAIHTIETVLGSISHTASYLRLWALSLAHSQLSHVLFQMVLSKGLKNKLPVFLGVPALICAFFFWAILTIAILIMMEGLSAFLHTLRLHWVEFQSKFFGGAGVGFQPFRFRRSTRHT